MALEFYKRRFRKPGKKMQYFLAFTALLLAIATVAVWMFVRHKLSLVGSESGESDPSAAVTGDQYTAEDEARLLLICADDTQTRFILIHTDPANAVVTVSAIIDDTATNGDTSLSALYRKSGAARAVSAVSSALNVPLKHHMVLSVANVEKCCSRLENGVELTLSVPLTYPDSNGSTIPLSVGEHTLNAQQIAALIAHTDTPDQITADILAAILRQYLRTGRHLASDFDALFNNTQTSLRIDNFREYQDALTHLAAKNAEELCSVTSNTLSLP